MSSVTVPFIVSFPVTRERCSESYDLLRSVSVRNIGNAVHVADSTARTLALLSLLQTHRHWAGGELAARLGVSERTVRRDIERLRHLGYPVDAAPGVDGGYQLAVGAHLPPLLFDDDEAVALAIGLRTAAGSAIDGVEETAVRVMAKLERMLPDRVRRQVEAVHGNVSVLRWAPTTDPVAASTLATIGAGLSRSRGGSIRVPAT